MYLKSKNTLILRYVLQILDACNNQLVHREVTPLNRIFRDVTEIQLRVKFLRELGIKDCTISCNLLKSLDLIASIDEVFDLSSNIHVITEDEEKCLFRVEGDLVSYWPEINRYYPTSKGALEFGIPFYNDAHDIACLYVGQMLGPKVGSGFIYSFRQENSTWHFDRKMFVWIS